MDVEEIKCPVSVKSLLTISEIHVDLKRLLLRILNREAERCAAKTDANEFVRSPINNHEHVGLGKRLQASGDILVSPSGLVVRVDRRPYLADGHRLRVNAEVDGEMDIVLLHQRGVEVFDLFKDTESSAYRTLMIIFMSRLIAKVD